MQRQSLSSPSSRLLKLDEEFTVSETHPKQHTSSFQSSSTSLFFLYEEFDDSSRQEDLKKTTTPAPVIPHTYIHFIPILTFLCFLILYLSSRAPSPHDLAEFSGFQISSAPSGSEENARRVVEIKDGDVSGIRRLKDLEATAKLRLRRRHRKMSRA